MDRIKLAVKIALITAGLGLLALIIVSQLFEPVAWERLMK